MRNGPKRSRSKPNGRKHKGVVKTVKDNDKKAVVVMTPRE